MTIQNAKKKLGMLGPVQQRRYGSAAEYWVEHKGYVVSFLSNGEDRPDGHATCFHVKRIGDVADSQSDYFPGSYFKNLTRAIRYAQRA